MYISKSNLKNKYMKNIKLFFLSLIFVVTATAQDSNKEQLVVPLSDPGKPYKLNVDLVTGSIKVVGYEGKDIIIDAETESGKRREERSEGGMRKLSAHNLSIAAQVKNNQVHVYSEQPNINVQLTLKIPKTAESIKLETVNDGDIDVSSISGEMEISNTNGGIKLSNVSGSVVANSVNGNVSATFSSIDPKAPMAFSTLNGNVDVSFPTSLKADVRLKSEQGDVFTDFDVVVDQRKPDTEKTKEGNMYRLNVKDWIYGKIGGGGPEIMMNNMNGNIYVRKIKQ
jgi:DUF4097 and DUF4098 domain-containing protein YvlB